MRMIPNPVLVLLMITGLPGIGFAQDSVVSGNSLYGGFGGGLDLHYGKGIGALTAKAFKSNGWGLEAGFRRTGMEARNMPADYVYGRGGFNFGKVNNEMRDDINVWNAAIAHRWQSSKHPLVHGMLAAGVSLTDYFENQFTYTGVQSSGGWFASYSPNYSTSIDRQLLPGFYGRAAGDVAIARGFSLEAGVWTSLTTRVQLFGMEVLMNIGRMPHTKIIKVKGRTEKAKARFKSFF